MGVQVGRIAAGRCGTTEGCEACADPGGAGTARPSKDARALESAPRRRSGPPVSATPAEHARAGAGRARCSARVARVTPSAEYILLALSQPGRSPDGA